MKNVIALWSTWDALDGDHKRLAKRLRAGIASRAEMAFAADLIEGKIKPRRLRDRQPTRRTNDEIAQAVLFLEAIYPDWQQKKIIPRVAKGFGVSERHVYNVVHNLDPERRELILRSAPAVAAVVRGGPEFEKLLRNHELARK